MLYACTVFMLHVRGLSVWWYSQDRNECWLAKYHCSVHLVEWLCFNSQMDAGETRFIISTFVNITNSDCTFLTDGSRVLLGYVHL
jgi:hypothetical protein